MSKTPRDSYPSSKEMISRTLKAYAERFGIPLEYFQDYHLFTRKNDVWLCTKEAGEAALPQIVRKGLRIARVFDFTVKPTTNAIQLLGHLVTKNRILLNLKESQLFIAGQTQTVEIPDGASDGFVVAYYDEYALGIGLLKIDVLKSQVPRSRRLLAY